MASLRRRDKGEVRPPRGRRRGPRHYTVTLVIGYNAALAPFFSFPVVHIERN